MVFIGSLRTLKLPITHRGAFAERRRLRFSFFPLANEQALKQRQR